MSVVGSSAGVFCLTLLFLGLSFTSHSAFLLTTEYLPDHIPMVIFVDGCVGEFFVLGGDVGGGGGFLFTLCVDVCFWRIELLILGCLGNGDCLLCFVLVSALDGLDGDCFLCFVFLCFEDFLGSFTNVVVVCVVGCFFECFVFVVAVIGVVVVAVVGVAVVAVDVVVVADVVATVGVVVAVDVVVVAVDVATIVLVAVVVVVTAVTLLCLIFLLVALGVATVTLLDACVFMLFSFGIVYGLFVFCMRRLYLLTCGDLLLCCIVECAEGFVSFNCSIRAPAYVRRSFFLSAFSYSDSIFAISACFLFAACCRVLTDSVLFNICFSSLSVFNILFTTVLIKITHSWVFASWFLYMSVSCTYISMSLFIQPVMCSGTSRDSTIIKMMLVSLKL